MKRIFTAVKYYILTTDLLLISVALGISVLSVILLLGIENMEYFVIGMGVVKTQAAAVAIGIIGAVIASCIDYKQIARLWKLYAPPIILLMLLTYTSMGIRREGSSNKSWLNLMGVSIQPSEFLKIVVIITLAMHIAKVNIRT